MTRGVRWYLVGSLVLVALAGCGRWIAEREPWRHEAEEQCLKSGTVRESPSVSILKPIAGPGMCGADFPLKVAALGESAMLGYADDPVRPPGAIPQSAGSPRPPAGGSPPYSPAQSYPSPSYPASSGQGYPTPSVQSYPIPAPGEGAAGSPPYSPYASPRYAAPSPGDPLRITPPGMEPPPSDPLGSYATPTPNYASRPPPRTPYPPRAPILREPASMSRDGGPASDPVFSPTPLDRQSPYPPRYPPNGESVPLGPARGPQVTGSVGPATVSPPATLACPVVSALDRWVSESVQASALRWFGTTVVEIKQISAYSCRGMNGNPNSHISEHAFGNALDIAAFVLADGRTVTVKKGWRGAAEEQGFLRDVQGAACERFTTVLAPGSNVYHYDHIHVDLMRRASGRHICQPAAVPGDVVAARAGGRSGYAARRGDPAITGSIAPRGPSAGRRRHPDARFEDDADLPSAVPGED